MGWFKKEPEKPTRRMVELEDDLGIVIKKMNQLTIAMEGLATRIQKLEGRFYQHMGKEEPEEEKKDKPKEEDLYKHFNDKFF